MSSQHSDNEFWARAMDRGMSGQDQYDWVLAAAARCWDGGKKVPMNKIGEVTEKCQRLNREADYLLAHMGEVDAAIVSPHPMPGGRGQEASDGVYGNAYWNAVAQSPADLKKAIDALLSKIHTEGLTPTERAQLAAMIDVSRGRSPIPPVYDPNAKWVPPQPETPIT